MNMPTQSTLDSAKEFGPTNNMQTNKHFYQQDRSKEHLVTRNTEHDKHDNRPLP